MILDNRENLQKIHDYVKALEEERRKIESLNLEVPHSLELLTQAIDTYKQPSSSAATTTTTTTTTDCVNGQSDCSEQTTSHDLAFEFIPIKRSSEDDDNDEQESQDNSTQFNNKNDIENSSSGKKSDWLRSVKLWNQSSDPTTTDQESNDMKKVGVVDLKRISGAFLPLVAGVTDTTTPAAAHQAVSVCSTATEDGDGAPGMGKEGGGSKKSRRYWTPELKQNFVNVIQQLGGSHVAKPKQIRELMNVDGLTNDEVKSHLQKYRLHERRTNQSVHPNAGSPQPPQLAVVEGTWMPPPKYANTTMTAAGPTGIYAPVATAPARVPTSPQSERPSDGDHCNSTAPARVPTSPQSERPSDGDHCNSPATSSSTHTTTTRD